MSSNKNYEYENESSIDSKFLCSICLNPLFNPKRTSCEHIFCHLCIETWFEKNASCPLCRRFLPRKHLKTPLHQNLLAKLDQLPIKCLLCQETKIKRKDWNNHIDNQCPKAIIFCSTNHPKCSWKGPREDLPSHQLHCLRQFSKQNKFKFNFHTFKIKTLLHHSSFNSHVCLRHQQLTDQHMPMIIHLAIQTKQCQILDLSQNQILTDGIRLLAESLENNSTLKVLSLHQNSLVDISILHLAEKLSFNHCALKWLDLESTSLTDIGAEYLAIMLMTNTSLTGLWLSKNHIGYHGVKVLSSVLSSQNKTLKYLDLEKNLSIDDSSFHCLMEMIEQNRSLNIIYINNCQLSSISKSKLSEIANIKPNFRLFV